MISFNAFDSIVVIILRKLCSINDSFVDLMTFYLTLKSNTSLLYDSFVYVIETQFKNFIKIIIILNVFKNRILFFLTSTLFWLIINVIEL
jgi:hypothetical protein